MVLRISHGYAVLMFSDLFLPFSFVYDCRDGLCRKMVWSAMDAFMEKLTKKTAGSVTLKLYKGSVSVTRRKSIWPLGTKHCENTKCSIWPLGKDIASVVHDLVAAGSYCRNNPYPIITPMIMPLGSRLCPFFLRELRGSYLLLWLSLFYVRKFKLCQWYSRIMKVTDGESAIVHIF